LKTLIIYKSIHHENTLRVARVMASELDAVLSTPEEVDIDSLAQYDLIGFGSGIYMGKHHRSLLNFVKDLDSLTGKNTFVFYTSCRGLETYGPFRIGGGKNKGHPTETDLNNARDFAKSLITS